MTIGHAGWKVASILVIHVRLVRVEKKEPGLCRALAVLRNDVDQNRYVASRPYWRPIAPT